MTIDNLLQRDLGRRSFLKLVGGIGTRAAMGLPILLSSHCTSSPSEQEAVSQAPLREQPVPPLKNQCRFGFYPNIRSPKDWYKEKIGVTPGILVPPIHETSQSQKFPKTIVKEIASQGAIPFVYKDLTTFMTQYGFNLIGKKDFEDDLRQYAKDIVHAGEPIFLGTMREMNDFYPKRRPWKGKSPKQVKKLWRYIWQFLEDGGANEYATWVWSVICPESRPKRMRNPERFFPGSKYVGRIGLSAYSDLQNYYGSLKRIAGRTYRSMLNNHKDIGIMMCEMGFTRNRNQADNVANAFETLKSWPGITEAILWNTASGYYAVRSDYSLTPESFDVIKEQMKDPHFAGAGPIHIESS